MKYENIYALSNEISDICVKNSIDYSPFSANKEKIVAVIDSDPYFFYLKKEEVFYISFDRKNDELIKDFDKKGYIKLDNVLTLFDDVDMVVNNEGD